MASSSVVRFIALKEASEPSGTSQPAARRVRVDVLDRFVAWRHRRRTQMILSALDDRTLRDMGVERGEIDSIVRTMEIPKGR
jgi:uncharacterized protein YjiS (DUF1127 family)